MQWRTLKGERIGDVLDFVRDNAAEGQSVHLGTDSLQLRRVTRFVTVVAILNPGRGGRAAFTRDSVPRIASLRQRLMHEVWLSVNLGLRLHPVVPGELTVHIDANPVVTHRSSAYVQELVGLVVSQGFRAQVKPGSWAATHAADRMVRAGSRPPATRPLSPGPAARPPRFGGRRGVFRARVVTKGGVGIKPA
jgi:predicted RNase H-related nuclease YkuK (DUF458 family)